MWLVVSGLCESMVNFRGCRGCVKKKIVKELGRWRAYCMEGKRPRRRGLKSRVNNGGAWRRQITCSQIAEVWRYDAVSEDAV